MKSKISQATKKSISLLLAILVMFSMLTVGLTVTVNAAIDGVFAEGETIYFDFNNTGANQANILNDKFCDGWYDQLSKKYINGTSILAIKLKKIFDVNLDDGWGNENYLVHMNINGNWYNVGPKVNRIIPQGDQNCLKMTKSDSGVSYVWTTYGSTTDKHTVTFNQPENGSISGITSGATFAKDATVSFKVKANDGYQISAVTLSDGTTPTMGSVDGDGYTNYTFTMPASDVTISATISAVSTPDPTPTLSELFFYQNSGGPDNQYRQFTSMQDAGEGKFKIVTNFPINNEFKLVSSNSLAYINNTKVEDSKDYCVSKRDGFNASKVSFSDSLKTANASVTVDAEYRNIAFNKGSSTATNFVVEYTPAGDTGLDGTIKIWTFDEYPGGNTDPTEPTPTTDPTTDPTTAPTTAPTTDPTPTNPTLAKPKLTGTSFVFPGDAATVSVSNIADDYKTITGVTFDFNVKKGDAAFTDFTKTEDGTGITFTPEKGITYSVTATASAEGYTTSAATKTPFTVKVAIVPFAEANRIYAYAATLADGAKPVFNAWTAVESDVAAKNVYKNYNNGQYDADSIPTLGATTDTNLRVFLPTGSSATQVVLYNSFSTNITIGTVTIEPGKYGTVDYTPYTDTNKSTLTVKFANGTADKTIKVYRSQAQGALYINNTDAYAGSTDGELNMLRQLYKGKEEGEIEGGCSGAIVTRDQLPKTVNKVADVTVKKIKGRGNSTWRSTDKKSFNVNFNENLGGRFLNEGFTGKKYSLLANFKDPSLSRNKILYALGDDMGDKVGAKYSPDVATIDLYLNGLYMGNYLMCQKVDVGSKELINDLGKTLFEDLYGDFAAPTESTDTIKENGFSFLMELDTNAGTGDFYFKVNHGGFDQTLTIKEPEYLNEKDSSMYQDALTTAIEGFVAEKYKALIDALDGKSNLSDIIDVASLARYMMLNELAKNFDIGVSSTYFVYNKGEGKFYISPVWDLDVTTGNCKETNSDYQSYENYWTDHNSNSNNVMKKVFSNAAVKEAVKSFWTVDFYNSLVKKIDDLATAAKTDAKGSFENNYVKWTSANGFQGEYKDDVKNKSSLKTATYTNGSYTKANTDTQYKSDTNTYSNSEITYSQIDYVAAWLKSRAAWLTSQYATGSTDPTKPTDPSEPSSTPSTTFKSVTLNGTVNGEQCNDTIALSYENGVWSVTLNFTGAENHFKARVDNDWTTSFGDPNGTDYGNYTETLNGKYKISIADGAADGTRLTIEKVTEEPTNPTDSTDPTAPTDSTDPTAPTEPTPTTKTVYVGVISYISNSSSLSNLKVHYWGNVDANDADCTRLGDVTVQKSVGLSYWSGAEQTFYMYKAEVPTGATGFKVHIDNTWYGEDGDLTTNNAAFIFNFDGDKALYDNYYETKDYTFIYNYKEFNTTKGMAYVNDPSRLDTKSFTKTVTVTGDEAAVKAAYLANAPKLKNNYFTYSFGEPTVNGTTVTATATETAKTYEVNVTNTNGLLLTDVTGTGKYNYQAVVTLTAPDSIANPVWKNGDTVLAIGKEYKFRITGDIKLICDDDATVTELSTATVVNTPTYELYIKQETNTERIRFNYLVENFNTPAGAEYGVLFTVDYSATEDELKHYLNGTTANDYINQFPCNDKANKDGKYIFTVSLANTEANASKKVYVYSYIKPFDSDVIILSKLATGSIEGSGILN